MEKKQAGNEVEKSKYLGHWRTPSWVSLDSGGFFSILMPSFSVAMDSARTRRDDAVFPENRETILGLLSKLGGLKFNSKKPSTAEAIPNPNSHYWIIDFPQGRKKKNKSSGHIDYEVLHFRNVICRHLELISSTHTLSGN